MECVARLQAGGKKEVRQGTACNCRAAAQGPVLLFVSEYALTFASDGYGTQGVERNRQKGPDGGARCSQGRATRRVRHRSHDMSSTVRPTNLFYSVLDRLREEGWGEEVDKLSEKSTYELASLDGVNRPTKLTERGASFTVYCCAVC